MTRRRGAIATPAEARRLADAIQADLEAPTAPAPAGNPDRVVVRYAEPGHADHRFSAHSLRPGECRICGQGAGFHFAPLTL